MEANPSSKDASSADLQFGLASGALRRSGHKARFHALGFTLIELMAVLLIILVLAGIVLGVGTFVQRKENLARAKAELVAIENALEAYRLDTGAYPTSSLIRASTATPKITTIDPNVVTNGWLLSQQLISGSKKYFQFRPKQLTWFSDGCLTNPAAIIDPYGNPYFYYCVRPSGTDQVNKVSFDLWSCGPDSISQTGNTAAATSTRRDDITNW